MKKKKNYFFLKYIIIIFIFFLIIFLIFCLSLNASNFYLDYSVAFFNEKISNVINSGLSDDTIKLFDADLYKVIRDSSGMLESVDYNSYLINVILKKVTDEVNFALNNLDDTNNYIKIPMFALFNNPLVNNYGPLITVRIKNIGYVVANVFINVKDYGINNSLFEVIIKISVTEKILLPIISRDLKFETEIPISYKIINGKVPAYYNNTGKINDSNILSIPFAKS